MSDKSELSFDEKRKRINEKRRERRQRKIEEDPEYLKRESEKRRELRVRFRKENPEAHKAFLESEKLKRNEKHSEYGKLWRERNPDKCREYAKRSYEKRKSNINK